LLPSLPAYFLRLDERVESIKVSLISRRRPLSFSSPGNHHVDLAPVERSSIQVLHRLLSLLLVPQVHESTSLRVARVVEQETGADSIEGLVLEEVQQLLLSDVEVDVADVD
jgi:hypothetical protein